MWWLRQKCTDNIIYVHTLSIATIFLCENEKCDSQYIIAVQATYYKTLKYQTYEFHGQSDFIWVDLSANN